MQPLFEVQAAVEQPATSAGGEGALADSIATQMAATDPSTGIFITAMFVLAVVGLVVLTGGVAYLAYADWKDKRELEELQKQAAPPKVEKKPAPAEATLGAAKGFGKKASSK